MGDWLDERRRESAYWEDRAYDARKDAERRAENHAAAARAFERNDLPEVARRFGMYDTAIRIAEDRRDRVRVSRVDAGASRYADGRRHLDNGEFFKAELDFDLALLHEPGNPGYRYARAFAALRQEKYEAALDDFDAAERGGAPAGSAAYMAGVCALNLGRLDVALARFGAAAGERDDADLWFYTGVTHMKGATYPDAAKAFAKSVAHAPKDAALHYHLGVALTYAGKAKRGLASFDRARDLAFDSPRLPLHRGEALMELGHNKAALACFAEAVSLLPADPYAHAQHGEALLRLERFDDAERAFGVQIEREAKRIGGYLNRGYARERQGRLNEALGDFDQARTMAPRSPRPELERARCLRRMKRFEGALAAVDRSLELGPGFAPAMLRRAEILADLKRDIEAVAEAERAADAFRSNGNKVSEERAAALVGRISRGWR